MPSTVSAKCMTDLNLNNKECETSPTECLAQALVETGGCVTVANEHNPSAVVTHALDHKTNPDKSRSGVIDGGWQGKRESGESGTTSTTASSVSHAGAAYFPANSIIGWFVKFSEQQIETARAFIVAAAIIICSMLLNRRVYFVWGSKRIYPGLYIACVGPSGASRKSELMGLVRPVLEELCPGMLLADYSSHERLVEAFAEQPIRAMVYSEGKNLVDSLNSSPTLTGDILQVYDGASISTDFKCNEGRSQDGTSRIEAKDTFLSILLGITSEGLRFSERNRHNGLMGRCEFLYAAGRGRDILTAPPVLAAERNQLVAEFKSLKQLKGEMRFSPEAERLWIEMQRQNRCLLDDNPPEAVASYIARAPFATIRVAMIFEAATTGKCVISASTLILASGFTEMCRHNYLHFLGEMGKSSGQLLEDRAVETLKRNGGLLSHSELLKRLTKHGQWQAAEFKVALQHLAAEGLIRLVSNPATKFPDVILVQDSESTQPMQPAETKGPQTENLVGRLPESEANTVANVPVVEVAAATADAASSGSGMPGRTPLLSGTHSVATVHSQTDSTKAIQHCARGNQFQFPAQTGKQTKRRNRPGRGS